MVDVIKELWAMFYYVEAVLFVIHWESGQYGGSLQVLLFKSYILAWLLLVLATKYYSGTAHSARQRWALPILFRTFALSRYRTDSAYSSTWVEWALERNGSMISVLLTWNEGRVVRAGIMSDSSWTFLLLEGYIMCLLRDVFPSLDSNLGSLVLMGVILIHPAVQVLAISCTPFSPGWAPAVNLVHWHHCWSQIH